MASVKASIRRPTLLPPGQVPTPALPSPRYFDAPTGYDALLSEAFNDPSAEYRAKIAALQQQEEADHASQMEGADRLAGLGLVAAASGSQRIQGLGKALSALGTQRAVLAQEKNPPSLRYALAAMKNEGSVANEKAKAARQLLLAHQRGEIQLTQADLMAQYKQALGISDQDSDLRSQVYKAELAAAVAQMKADNAANKPPSFTIITGLPGGQVGAVNRADPNDVRTVPAPQPLPGTSSPAGAAPAATTPATAAPPASGSSAAPAGPKPMVKSAKISDKVMEGMQTRRDTLAAVTGLLPNFKDEYGSGGVLGPAKQYLSHHVGSDAPKRRQEYDSWWTAYNRLMQLKLRHEMFGSALTPSEITAWNMAQAIRPGAPAEQIRAALSAMQAATTEAIRTNAASRTVQGVAPEALAPYENVDPQQAAAETGIPGATTEREMEWGPDGKLRWKVTK